MPEDTLPHSDRIRIDCLADVPPHFGPRIVNVIRRMARSRGLYTFVHFDKNAAQIVVEITNHDRVPAIEINDTRALETLRLIALERGKTIQDIIAETLKS